MSAREAVDSRRPNLNATSPGRRQRSTSRSDRMPHLSTNRRRLSGPRANARVAGQNVTPFRSSAVSHRPVGSNTAPIVVTGPRPSTIGSASGGPVRSHIRNPCPWRAATIHWLVRSNATPLIGSVGFSDKPVSCRGSLAWTNEPTRSAPVSSSNAICSPLPSSQKLDTGVLVRSTIRCPAAPAFNVDASTCRSPGYETK